MLQVYLLSIWSAGIRCFNHKVWQYSQLHVYPTAKVVVGVDRFYVLSRWHLSQCRPEICHFLLPLPISIHSLPVVKNTCLCSQAFRTWTLTNTWSVLAFFVSCSPVTPLFNVFGCNPDANLEACSLHLHLLHFPWSHLLAWGVFIRFEVLGSRRNSLDVTATILNIKGHQQSLKHFESHCSVSKSR